MCKQDGLCTYYYIFSKVYSSYCVYVNIVVYIRCFASKINSLYFMLSAKASYNIHAVMGVL